MLTTINSRNDQKVLEDDAEVKVRFDTSMSELDREAIRAMRRSYGEVGLENLPFDPFAAFSAWLYGVKLNLYSLRGVECCSVGIVVVVTN